MGVSMKARMPNTAVVGVQWGDEGKGKIVDMLAARAGIVVRFQGGNNAGHTLVVAGEKVVLHLVPSGILHPSARCVLGNGVVMDPEVLVAELDALEASGRKVDAARLGLSRDLHVIMPYHRSLDAHREEARGGGSIGTTRKGIGPTYEDKVARRGIRLADFIDLQVLASRIQQELPLKNRQIVEWYEGEAHTAEDVLAWAAPLAERLAPHVCDVAGELHAALDVGTPMLFEGAQGTFLDIDHGSYPFVTSSNTVAGAACAGSGVGPGDLQEVVGIAKAYATRVGAGPFPTELDDDLGAHLRRVGREFGSTTGRPRRCGWFDAELVRRAARLNGLTCLVLTKLDVLSGLEVLRIGRGSDADGEAIYEDHPGWTEDLTACRSWDSLPASCQAYIRRVEALVGVPVALASVGPDRVEIVPVDPARSAWMLSDAAQTEAN